MANRAEAINFLMRAMGDAQSGLHQQAYQLLSSAVIADPTYAEGWFTLGQTNWSLGLGHSALAAYRRALECPEGEQQGDLTRGLKAKVFCNMGHVAYHLGMNEEARKHTLASIALDDKLAFAVCNMSLIQSVEGLLDVSLDWARTAHDMAPTDPTIETALAFALLFKRRWGEGLKHFEARFPYKLPHFISYPFPKWQGERDKVLFVVSEQGLGDSLSYSRFIEQACKVSSFVHFGVQPELARLMRAAFQHVPNLNIVPQPCPFPPADYWSTPMSLPVALGLTDEEIENAPNIQCPNFSMKGQWKDPTKFNIGVAWSGSPGTDINHHKSFPVTQLLELYRVPGIQIYSLQCDDKKQELHAAGCATLIRDLSPSIRDAADSIAIVKDLDLIITTESFLGHIGGLCGVETWICYSYQGRSFHIGHDGSSGVPYYPLHRVWKQSADRQWSPVFARIVDHLADKVKSASLREAAE